MTLDVLGDTRHTESRESEPRAIDRAVEVLNGHDGNSDVEDEMRASLQWQPAARGSLLIDQFTREEHISTMRSAGACWGHAYA